MSKRLQVVLDDEELEEIRAVAERKRLTVSEWVRRTLREARSREPARSTEAKLETLRRASRHDFPTGDIGQLLEEIASGYLADSAP